MGISVPNELHDGGLLSKKPVANGKINWGLYRVVWLARATRSAISGVQNVA